MKTIQRAGQPSLSGLEPVNDNFIGTLNAAWPTEDESISQGDDHIRAIKDAMLNHFPSITESFPLSEAETNSLAQENHLIGTICWYFGTEANLPSGWEPFLSANNRTIKGWSPAEPAGTTGGVMSVTGSSEMYLEERHLPPHKHSTDIYSGGNSGASGVTDCLDGHSEVSITTAVEGRPYPADPANPVDGELNSHSHSVEVTVDPSSIFGMLIRYVGA
ncbi:hypothetical protein AB4331_05955 [Vibrio breoganii]